jgi:hypothetical protein
MDDMSQLDQAEQEWIKRIVLKNPVGSGNPLTPVKTRQSLAIVIGRSIL